MIGLSWAGIPGPGIQAVYADTEYNDFDQDITLENNNEHVVVRAPGKTISRQYIVEQNVTGVTLELDPTSGALDMDASGTEHSAIYLKSGSSATVIINGDVTVKGGHYRGTGANTGYAAIAVNKDATLNLIVNGKLTAYAGDGGENRGAAAIGGSDGSDSGIMNITVNDGGELYCESGDGGAAIGGGDGYSANKPISITTNGTGKITAKGISKGSGGGAGIGGGDGGSSNSTIDITMNDSSTIYAEGITGGAGIGGGGGHGCGAITINMNGTATLTALGGDGAAGIGGGDGGDTGDITINGWGNIDATAGFAGAAIGGGDGAACGKITIHGDSSHQSAEGLDFMDETGEGFDGKSFALNITARASQEEKTVSSYYGPNIGGKQTGNISIEYADILCVYPKYAAMYAASIGCGYGGSVDDITIKNSRLKQNTLGYGSYNCYGAMIGEGWGGDVDTIKLEHVWCSGRSIGGAAWDGGDIESISIALSYVYADAAETNHIVSAADKLKYSYPVAGIGSGKDASIGLIDIYISNIQAFGKCGGAGIGSGGLYVGGSNLGNLFETGGKCGDIRITGSTVSARGANGGAGIGGGGLTSVDGSISFSYCTVEASAINSDYNQASGAGIGGGSCCGCGDISIADSTVTASTARFSAGIGSGGVADANFFGGIVEASWDAEIGNIDINYSKVTATGGENGAGIGNGWGAQQGKNKHISINNSTVTARGGDYAAGIGGGNNSEFERGGDISNVNITGRSRVEATGGEEGAGIGGGSQGELHGCTIELNEDLSYEPMYYVKAWGGTSAAGIGSGPSHAADLSGALEGAHAAYDITIKSGFVYAKGGGDKQLSNVNGKYWIGAGAGIGGGGRGGLKNFTMSGGVVAAEHQDSVYVPGIEAQTRQASDIGHGGGYAPLAYSDTGCSNFNISGGTVDCGLCDETTITVTGGSLRDSRGGDHPSDPKAKNASGAKVFKNTINIEPSSMLGAPVFFAGRTYYGLSVKDVSTEYGTTGIYGTKVSDTRARVWLHLPESAENSAHATISEGGEDYLYYGTTAANDNTNLLKMGSQMILEPEMEGAKPAAQSAIKLVLNTADSDASFPEAEYTYSVSGTSNPSITEQKGKFEATDDGPEFPYVVVYTEKEGDLTVTASCGDAESDMYWGLSAEYTDTVGAARIGLTINKDLSKVYDGQNTYLSAFSEDNEIIVEPDAARGENGSYISQVFYKSGTTAPIHNNSAVEPGDYYVIVTVSDRNSSDGSFVIDGVKYSPAAARQDFTISKYTQEFKVTSPEPQVLLSGDGQAAIEPEWELVITDKDEQGKTMVPPPGKMYINPSGGIDDDGEVTVTYRSLDSDDQTPMSEAPTQPGSYQMILSAKETDHYYAAETIYDFQIIDHIATQLSVHAEDKVYDGEPVSDPEIECSREADGAEYEYFISDGNGGWTAIQGRPTDAGDYKVSVNVPKSGTYAAASAEAEFSITPRTVILDADASRIYDNGNPTDGASVRIRVANGVAAMAGKTVRITVKPEGGSAITTEAQLAVDPDTGTLYAEADFANVGAGTYTVSAEIEDDSNFAVYNTPEEFTKDSRAYLVEASDHTAELDDGVFDLDVSVTDPLGLEAGNYSITYEITDPETGGAGKAVVAIEGGKLKIIGAGTDIIKITVEPGAEDNVHSVSVGYATVTVNKGKAKITVNAAGKTYDGHPAEVTAELSYGGKDYPVDYDADKIQLEYFVQESDGSLSSTGGAGSTGSTGGASSAGGAGTAGGTSSASEPVDAGTYAVRASAPDDDNFTVSGDYAGFIISRAGIKVKTASDAKVYDGKPLTNDEAEITGLVDGETAEITATGSQTEIGSSKNTYRIKWAGSDPQNLTAKRQNYTVTEEKLGILKVIDPATLYEFTEGADGEWTRGSTSTLDFTIVRTLLNKTAFSHFAGVKVDGKAIDESSYDAESGSVNLSLKPDYLETLSTGKHDLSVVFDDGSAETSFTIADNGTGENPSNDPPGGGKDDNDNSNDPSGIDDGDNDGGAASAVDESGSGESGSGSNSDNGSGSSSGSGSVRTGDDSRIVLWAGVGILSAMLLACLLLRRKYMR